MNNDDEKCFKCGAEVVLDGRLCKLCPLLNLKCYECGTSGTPSTMNICYHDPESQTFSIRDEVSRSVLTNYMFLDADSALVETLSMVKDEWDKTFLLCDECSPEGYEDIWFCEDEDEDY